MKLEKTLMTKNFQEMKIIRWFDYFIDKKRGNDPANDNNRNRVYGEIQMYQHRKK